MKYGIKNNPEEWGAGDSGTKKVISRVNLLAKHKGLDPGHEWRCKKKALNMVLV